MATLTNLLIEQGNIFLAPGCYFHSEFNGVGYNDFPPLLQRKHNQQLIHQYHCLCLMKNALIAQSII